MNRHLARLVALAALIALSRSAVAAETLPRLRSEGGRILDAAGKPVILRGVNLGNWLLFEPGGIGNTLGRLADQHTLFTILRDRFGEAERYRLMSLYRDNYITARDFDNVKRFGFNFVRIGFDYEIFEDDARPMQLRPEAFKYLDFAVREAKARGLYILFDLHGAQERQVAGKQSGRNGYTQFWKLPQAQERSLWLWDQIIARYKGDPTVMGYEPLNEPWGGKREELFDYCSRWYQRLRKIDTEAIAVFPGWYGDIDFHGNPTDNGWANVMFDMHFYPGHFDTPPVRPPYTPQINTRFIQRDLPRWATTMKRVNAPLLIGEMNIVHKDAGGGEMARRYYDFAAEQGWAVTYWTLKELTQRGGVGPSMWMLTTNQDPIPVVDINTATLAEIEAALRDFATMPLAVDDDLLHWLTTDAKPSPLPTTRPNR